MTMTAPTTGVGARPHRVTLQNPGPAVPDGDGGFTQSWVDLTPPALSMEIKPATARDLEHVTAGTVIAQATHLVTGPFHAGVTTKTRVLFNGREFHVVGVADPEERHVELVLVCVEIVA